MGQSRQGVATSDPGLITWGEVQAERAALVEYDGNIPREWAEGFARLDPDRPPGDVPLKRWQRFVDDVGLFLDSPFCSCCRPGLGTARPVRVRPRPTFRQDRSGRAALAAQ